MMRKLELKELNRTNVAKFKEQEKTPIVLVLDNIRSGLNVGSAFRTADAFALEKIYLCGITAIPPHREILKTAIGATESVDWVHHDSTLETVSGLKAAGYRIVVVEQVTQSTPLQQFLMDDRPLALVFGNEVKGVNQAVVDFSSEAIEIPQFGTKHSLNISVSLGIVVWTCFTQWKY